MKSCWANWLCAILGCWAFGAMASGGGNAPAEGVNYIAITPPLIVNYGGAGKVRFIKAELSIRAETAEDATEVMHHLPLIRDRLVSILSAQTEEVISTAEGKEYLRVYALAEINKALLKVEGHDAHEKHGGKEAEGEKSGANGGDKKKASEKSPENHVEEPAGSHDAHTSSPGPATPSLPSIADITPVKGPASDLFFNNFVVQK